MSTANIKVNTLLLIASIIFLLFAVYQIFGAIAANRIDANLFFNPDALTHAMIFKDLVIDKNTYNSWYFADSPSFFPDMFIYSIAYLFTRNIPQALVLTALCIFTGILLLIALIYSEVYKEVALMETYIPFFLGGLLLTLMTNGRFLLLLVFSLSPNFHVGTLLISLIGIYVCMKILKTDRTFLYIALFLITFLTAASDKLIMIHFIAPIVCSLILLGIDNPQEKKKVIKTIMTLLVALTCSLLTYQVLMPIKIPRTLGFSYIFLEKFSKDILSYLTTNKLSSNIAGKEYYFHNDEAILICASILLMIGFIYFTTKHWINTLLKKTNKTLAMEKFLIMHFFIFLFLSNLSGVILSQLYAGYIHLRYITPILFFPMFVLIFFASRIFINISGNFRLIIAFLFGILIILNSHVYKPKTILALGDYQNELVKCIDNNKDKYTLTNGVSDYWNAEEVSFFSKKDIRVNAIETPIDRLPTILYWNSNLKWYLKNYRDPHYNFIITERLLKDKILHTLGNPDEQFSCPGGEVYVYKNNNIDNFLWGILSFEELKEANSFVTIPLTGARGEVKTSGDAKKQSYYQFSTLLYTGKYETDLEYTDMGKPKHVFTLIDVIDSDTTYVKNIKAVDLIINLEDSDSIILERLHIKRIL